MLFNYLHITKTDKQKGNILLSSLLVILIMSLLGVGLSNVSVKEWTAGTYKNIDVQSYNMGQTCYDDVVEWFGLQFNTPSSIDAFSGTAGNHNKLSGYSYNCTVTYLRSKKSKRSVTTGVDISNAGAGYNSSDTIVKDFYNITTRGNGPKNSTKQVVSTVAVEY